MSSYRSRIFILETVVVLATISLVFSFGLVRYSGLIRKSFEVETFHQFRNIKMAQEFFRIEHGRYADSLKELEKSSEYFSVYEQPHFDYSMETEKKNYFVTAAGKKRTPVSGVVMRFNSNGLISDNSSAAAQTE
ncbi:MAG: hypothetical protein KC649_01105 [Candidatus Omnitrophica bacterium]|nr:hypothetical protein [Candidatus Omnitrophota bacterium]